MQLPATLSYLEAEQPSRETMIPVSVSPAIQAEWETVYPAAQTFNIQYYRNRDNVNIMTVYYYDHRGISLGEFIFHQGSPIVNDHYSHAQITDPYPGGLFTETAKMIGTDSIKASYFFKDEDNFSTVAWLTSTPTIQHEWVRFPEVHSFCCRRTICYPGNHEYAEIVMFDKSNRAWGECEFLLMTGEMFEFNTY
jgi:hypothetical protein